MSPNDNLITSTFMYNIDNIIRDIENNCFTEISNPLSLDEQDQIKDYVAAKVEGHDNVRFTLIGSDLDNTPLEAINRSGRFRKLCADILKRNGIKVSDDFEFYYALGGNNGDTVSHTPRYHFDAFYLTVVFPIFIPHNTQANGKLNLVPLRRNIHRTATGNFLLKVLMQNILISFVLNLAPVKRLLKVKEINLSEDCIYIFYGYRTLHSVGYHDSGLRSTAVFHTHNPHSNSYLNKAILTKHHRVPVKGTQFKYSADWKNRNGHLS